MRLNVDHDCILHNASRVMHFDTMTKSRLTIVSREAKKKQAVCDEQLSYLHVAPLLKFVNAPLKLSLSYQGLST